MVSVHLAKLSKTVQVIIQLQRKSEPSNITLLKRVVQEFHLQETVPFPVSCSPTTPWLGPRFYEQVWNPPSWCPQVLPSLSQGDWRAQGLGMSMELVPEWAMVTTELENIPK